MTLIYLIFGIGVIALMGLFYVIFCWLTGETNFITFLKWLTDGN